MSKSAPMRIYATKDTRSLPDILEDVKLAHSPGSPKWAPTHSLTALLFRLMKRIPAWRGVLLVPDQAGDFVVAEAFDCDGVMEDREQYKFSRTLARRARDTLDVFIYNPADHQGADHIPTATGTGADSILVAPVWDGTKVLAVLELLNKKGGVQAFTEEDMWTLGVHAVAIAGCLAELGAPRDPSEPRGADRLLGNAPGIIQVK